MSDSSKLGWKLGDLNVSQCAFCKHADSEGGCKAFGEKIPDVILLNQFDHREPYEGDNGIRFEPVEGTAV